MKSGKRQRLSRALVGHAAVDEIDQHVAREIEAQVPAAGRERGVAGADEHAAQLAGGAVDVVERHRHTVAEIGELATFEVVAETPVLHLLAKRAEPPFTRRDQPSLS